MHKFPTIKEKDLRVVAEQNVFWSGGIEYPWQGDALTTPGFIAALVKLAARAPYKDKQDFIKIWEDA